MPAYNASETIVNSINSVVNQTYQNWELIIVDDHSVDNTRLKIKTVFGNESRIILYESRVNSGTSASRNIALRLSTGRYITFLDSDDILESNYLESQLNFIYSNGPLVTANYKMTSSKNTAVFEVPNQITYKKLLKQNYLSCLTTFYDKEIIGEYFFPEGLAKAEDYVFWLNILKKGIIARGNKTILATYYIHSKSKSYSKLRLVKPMFNIYYYDQKLGLIKSIYYLLCWAIHGIIKYRKVR